MAEISASDHELIELVRAGDLASLGVLYERHREAGLRVARAVTGDAHRAEDIVSDAFERIHGAISRGAGPDDSFRAYLYTVIRRLAIEQGADRARLDDTDDFTPYEAITAVDDGTERSAEAVIVGSAFAALAPRHQAVLWYVDVEGLSTAEAATYFGLSANATAALANRARSALKDAYLQAHVSGTGVAAACLPVRGKLGPYRAGTLAARDVAKVEAHLDDCDECPVVLAELADVAHGLRVIIAPLVIGGAVAAATALGGAPESAMAAGVGASLPTDPRGEKGSGLLGSLVIAAVAAAFVVAAGAAIATGSRDDASQAQSADSIIAATATAIPVTATPTSMTPTPTTPSRSPATVAPVPVVRTAPSTADPTVTPTATPTPATPPAFTTTFGDAGDLVRGRVGMVVLEVTNTGGDSAAAVLDLVLPDGVTLDGARTLTATGDPAWTCVAATAGIRCTAATVPAGSTSTVTVPVIVSASAPLDVAPSATLTDDDGVATTATAATQIVATGLGTRFLADGSLAVVHAGAGLLSCDILLTGCLEARQRAAGAAIDNNSWAMIPIDGAGFSGAGVGAPSSSTRLDLPDSATVRFAGLYWSGQAPSATTGGLADGAIRAPGSADVVAVTASALTFEQGRYVAFADVTDLVSAAGGGVWSFGGAFTTAGVNAAAGWSLVVVVDDPTASPSRVAVFEGQLLVYGSTAATFTLPTVAGGEVSVGVVAWEGDAGNGGDRVLADDVPLVRSASGASSNVFASWADGAIPFCDETEPGCLEQTNTLGFDTGLFDPVTVTGARVRVDVVSPTDAITLGVVSLVTR